MCQFGHVPQEELVGKAVVVVAAFIAVLSLHCPAAFAAGWTQPPGESYTKIWGTRVAGTNAYTLTGDAPTQPMSLTRLSIYHERGFTPDITFVASAVPVGWATYGDATTGYVGPILGGARLRIFAATAQVALEVRLGGDPGLGDVDLATAEEFEFRPSVRRFVSEHELQLGLPLSGWGWFAASVGSVVPGNRRVAPAVTGFIQVGGVFLRRIVADVHVTSRYAIRLEELNASGAGDTRYIGAGFGVSYKLTDHFAVNAGLDGGAAKANIAAPVVSLGVELVND